MPDEKTPAEKPDDTAKAGTADTKPADPTDDLVTTQHQLRVGRKTLEYTATTGRIVLRDEVYEDGKFTGFKAKAEMSMTVVRRRRRRPATGR